MSTNKARLNKPGKQTAVAAAAAAAAAAALFHIFLLTKALLQFFLFDYDGCNRTKKCA